MSLQSQNSQCGHMETDDAPCRCNCYVRRHGIPLPIPLGNYTPNAPGCPTEQADGHGGQASDPLAWMDEVGHTNERTKHEKEWIAVMRKRFSDAGGSGTGDYCMWLEERLYGLVGGADVNRG